MSYPISDELFKLFTERHKQIADISLYGTAESINLTEEDIVEGGLTIDRRTSSGTKIEMGSAIAAELSLDLNNKTGKFNDIVFEGAELFVNIGVYDEKLQKRNLVPMGYFIVDNSPRKLSTIHISALDRMVLFDKATKPDDIVFPTTIGDLLTTICEVCNVKLYTDPYSLLNHDYSITECPQGQDMTYRQWLIWICEITGSCAYIDWDGKLRLEWYESFNATQRRDVSGEVISVHDVATPTHNVGCKVESKNLVKTNYTDADKLGKTIDGITATLNDDYSVTFKGTAINEYYFHFTYLQDSFYIDSNRLAYLKGLPYSESNTYEHYDYRLTSMFWNNKENKNEWISVYGDELAYYFEGISLISYVAFNVNKGATINVTVKPMVTYYKDVSYSPKVPDVSKTKVTVCGKNLFGGEKLANTIKELGGVISDNIVRFTGAEVNERYLYTFKENKEYTIIFYGKNDSTHYTNLVVSYSDNTMINIQFSKKNEYDYCIVHTEKNKIPIAIQGFWHTGTTFLEYDKCGIFEGNISLEDFQKYQGVDYVPNDKGMVQGIKSISPDMTITSDTQGVMINASYYADEPTDEKYIITRSDRFSSDLNENKVKITGVGAKQGEALTLNGSDEYMFLIESNGLLQHDVKPIVDSLGHKMVGFEYRPYEATIQPFINLYPMDRIAFVENDGNPIPTSITQTTFKLNGSMSIAGKGETTTITSRASANPLSKQEMTIIDQIKGVVNEQLNSNVQSVLALNEAIAGAIGLYTTTIKKDDGSVQYYFHNNPKLEDSKKGDVIYTLQGGGFAVCIDGWNNGNPVWSTGLTKDGNAILKYISANGITVSNPNVDYYTKITPEAFEIWYRATKIISARADESTFTKIKANRYLEVGRTRFIPHITGGKVIGTDIVFTD